MLNAYNSDIQFGLELKYTLLSREQSRLVSDLFECMKSEV